MARGDNPTTLTPAVAAIADAAVASAQAIVDAATVASAALRGQRGSLVARIAVLQSQLVALDQQIVVAEGADAPNARQFIATIEINLKVPSQVKVGS